MIPRHHPALRLVTDEPPDDPTLLATLDPQALAARELLRPAHDGPPGATGRELAPFSRAWFEELEVKRYAPHGGWLRRALEFSRHPSERLVMLGPGVGSDALQYHRHGTHVTVAAASEESAAAVRTNFEVRGLTVPLFLAPDPAALPFENSHFDLAYLNLLDAPLPNPGDLTATARELYRVLKPGGKVFALAPARYDAAFWQRRLMPWRDLYRPVPPLAADSPGRTARGLRREFLKFTEARTAKRHLRLAELPHFLRPVPRWLTERLAGRMLVFRAFKPVSAAWDELPRAA